MNTGCATCTRQLVALARERSLLFRWLREPLKHAMRVWVRLARIDLDRYEFTTPACHDCNRFYKNALKDHSAAFRCLNRLVNPVFDWAVERILGREAIAEAKLRAERRDEQTPGEDLESWIRI